MGNTTTYTFLQNGGDMGALIRANDWSQTPIGSPDTWPTALKNMVQVMLDNPFGMYIAWGPDYTQIYNDGYRPMIGEKHPNALGTGARATFPEIWDTIGPMFHGVMKGEPVRYTDLKLQLHRNEYPETCYFDFAYSPIRLDSGEVGGILVTVIETTNRKMAQDAVRASKDEMEFIIEAAELATFDYNPMTNKFTGNNRLKAWFGLPLEEEIELSDALASIAEQDRERVATAINEALDPETGGDYDIVYTVVNAITKKETVVHARGMAWFMEDGTAYRLNGALEDITEQTEAHIKTEETENHIKTMILESPIGLCLVDAETMVSEVVNDSFVTIVGKPKHTILDCYLWDTFAEVKDTLYATFSNVIATGEPFFANEMAVDLIKNGNYETVYMSFVYAPLKNKNGKVGKIAVWVIDNTPQVEARKEIMLSENNLRTMILQAPIAIAIFKGPDYIIEIANKYALELWGRTEEEVLNLPLFECMPELLSQGLNEVVESVTRTGKRFSTPEMPIHLVRNGQSEILNINFSIEPLYDTDGHINGIMTIGYDVTPQVQARKKIEQSAQEIRALVESAPFPIGVYEGEELRITLLNQSIMDIWDKGTDLIGKTYPEVLPELESQNIYEQLRNVIRTGKPFHAKNQRVDLFKGGALRPYYFHYSFTPLFDANGKAYAVMNTAAEVTELHEAYQKIEESERRFRESVKQAPLGIAIFRGPDYIAEMANESYLALVKKTEEEFIGQPMFESVPEVEDTLRPILEDIYLSGEDYHGYELPVEFMEDGEPSTHYFNFVYHPLNENNEISGFIVVVSEVTATVEARQLIEENEEKLQLIIDGSELGIFDANLKTGKVEASKRCYEILGFDGEHDLSQQELTAHMHPEDLKIRQKAFEQAFATGRLYYQSRIHVTEHSWRWMEAKGKVYFDDDNAPERVMGTIRDITEERNFQQQLLEREEKFRLLADSMPQYIWTADPDGNLTYFNQSMYDFTGFETGELLNDQWVHMVHPDDRDNNMKQWMHSVRTGENYLFEQRFRKHDGTYRWQLSRAIPQRDAEGEIKQWVGTSTDIQEQKMFTEELEKMVRRRTKELRQKNLDLEKMNKELQSFVYISSHDLQEPLRKIQTFSSRIMDNEYDSLTENAKKHFSRMQNSAFRMQNLIQDLIAYSRTNVQEVTYDVVNLSEILDDIKETLSEELENNDVTFHLKNICDIKIVSVQFKQVIHNLITNSIKFAKTDIPIEISIDCAEVDGPIGIANLSKNKTYIHIRYSDNGIGFEQAYNEKIFEVFQRLHSKDEYSGTGIGLAIVKRIVENHEGAIVADGQLGKGATFDIYLPAP